MFFSLVGLFSLHVLLGDELEISLGRFLGFWLPINYSVKENVGPEYFALTDWGWVKVDKYGISYYCYSRKGVFLLREEYGGTKGFEIYPRGPMETEFSCLLGNEPSRWEKKIRVYRELNLWSSSSRFRIRLFIENGVLKKVIKIGKSRNEFSVYYPGAESFSLKDGSLIIRYTGVDIRFRIERSGDVDVRAGLRKIAFVRKRSNRSESGITLLLEKRGISRICIEPIRFKYILAHKGYIYIAGNIRLPYQANVSCGMYRYTDFVRRMGTVILFNLQRKKVERFIIFGGRSGWEDVRSVYFYGERLYLCGTTDSDDFPVSGMSLLKTYGGGSGDAFVATFKKDLSDMRATYLGGRGDDSAFQIVANDRGVYILIYSTSPDLASNLGIDKRDLRNYGGVYIFRLDLNIRNLLSVARFPVGSKIILWGDSVYVFDFVTWVPQRKVLYLLRESDILDKTYLSQPPINATPGAYDTIADFGDVVIVKMSYDLKRWETVTFFGGDGNAPEDIGSTGLHGLSVDVSRNGIYIGWAVNTGGFPTNESSYISSRPSKDRHYTDVVLALIDFNLDSVSACTYLGGSSSDYVAWLGVGEKGDLYVVGQTYSLDFPCDSGIYKTEYDEHISLDGHGLEKARTYVLKLSPDLSVSKVSLCVDESGLDDVSIGEHGEIYILARNVLRRISF